MEQITIRNANAGDVPAVLGLLAEVNLIHHNGRPDLFMKGTKYSAKDLEAIFSSAHTPVFAALDENGVLLGYLFARFEQTLGDAIRTPVKTLYIDDLCVDEAARGKGVGKKLYAHAKDFARNSGAHNITLHVWELNPGARAFYERLGMKPQMTTMEEIL